MDTIHMLKNTFQARCNELSDAYNAHNIAGITAIYDKNAVLIAPGVAPVNGQEAIGDLFVNMSESLTELELTTDDIKLLDDDHAIELGHATYMAKGENEIVTKTNGNYVVVWEKGNDGGWHIISDIFNEGPQH